MPCPEAGDPEIVRLDVSGLEPPEPMERIFACLPRLEPGQLLRVLHRREPYPIYPMLEQAGYRHCCIRTGSEAFLIYCWHETEPVTEAYCRADAAVETQ